MSFKYYSAIFVVFHLLCLLGEADAVCSAGQIKCHSGSQCIDLSEVCSAVSQCSDSSDEDPTICSFWTYDSNCGESSFFCSNYGCQSVADFCNKAGCNSKKDPRICQIVKAGRLKLKSLESRGMNLTEELVNLLHKAVNTSSLNFNFSCPMFYDRVGDMCVSLFSPAKIPWPESRQFCLSIKGDLLHLKDLASYDHLLRYMRTSKLTTDYWIGGRFDLDTNAWSWVNDDTPMLLGAPYWATRYSSSCVPRSPPHTDPFSPPTEPLPGAPCYNYVQAPANRKQGWCTAMTYEHYYYITDEECQDSRSPLCLYIDK